MYQTRKEKTDLLKNLNRVKVSKSKSLKTSTWEMNFQ